MFSFSTSQNQPSQQSVNTATVPIERLTRVSDLSSDAQSMIEQLNQHVAQQISISESFKLNEEHNREAAQSVEADVKEVRRRHTNTTFSLSTHQGRLERLKRQVDSDIENTQISTRFVDGMRSGSLKARGTADHILMYFYETASASEVTMEKYEQMVVALEAHARTLQSSDLRISAETLIQTLRAQHEAFLQLSSAVAGTHDHRMQIL